MCANSAIGTTLPTTHQQTGCLTEEFNSNDPSRSVSVPWPTLQVKAHLHVSPISQKVCACFFFLKKLCSYEWAKLMQNRPLKSEV